MMSRITQNGIAARTFNQIISFQIEYSMVIACFSQLPSCELHIFIRKIFFENFKLTWREFQIGKNTQDIMAFLTGALHMCLFLQNDDVINTIFKFSSIFFFLFVQAFSTACAI